MHVCVCVCLCLCICVCIIPLWSNGLILWFVSHVASCGKERTQRCECGPYAEESRHEARDTYERIRNPLQCHECLPPGKASNRQCGGSRCLNLLDNNHGNCWGLHAGYLWTRDLGKKVEIKMQFSHKIFLSHRHCNWNILMMQYFKIYGYTVSFHVRHWEVPSWIWLQNLIQTRTWWNVLWHSFPVINELTQAIALI